MSSRRTINRNTFGRGDPDLDCLIKDNQVITLRKGSYCAHEGYFTNLSPAGLNIPEEFYWSTTGPFLVTGGSGMFNFTTTETHDSASFSCSGTTGLFNEAYMGFTTTVFDVTGTTGQFSETSYFGVNAPYCGYTCTTGSFYSQAENHVSTTSFTVNSPAIGLSGTCSVTGSVGITGVRFSVTGNTATFTNSSFNVAATTGLFQCGTELHVPSTLFSVNTATETHQVTTLNCTAGSLNIVGTTASFTETNFNVKATNIGLSGTTISLTGTNINSVGTINSTGSVFFDGGSVYIGTSGYNLNCCTGTQLHVDTIAGYSGTGPIYSNSSIVIKASGSSYALQTNILSNSPTAGTGSINCTDSLYFSAGKTVTVDTIQSATTNGNLNLTANGTGGYTVVPISYSGNHLVLTNGGKTGLGAGANPCMKVWIDSSSMYGLNFQDANGSSSWGNMVFCTQGGQTVGYISSNQGSTTYNTASDYRVKTNVTGATGLLQMVVNTNPVEYTLLSGITGDTGHIGFLAHEIQAIYPQCVTGVKDAVDPNTGLPIYQLIDYSKLMAIAFGAIRELTILLHSKGVLTS